MTAPSIGFIGAGEAGRVLAIAVRDSGASVAAYDLTESRVRDAGLRLLSPSELLASSDFVVSVVPAQAATEVAAACAPLLRAGQLYLDLASTSPRIKVEIATLIQSSPAEFVEGAILGAIGITGSATRIALSGAKARDAAGTLCSAGLNTVFLSEKIGTASTFKMLRSIFSKGVEALLIELLVTARRAGLAGEVWEDICDFMSADSFQNIAENWVRTHAVHCERRRTELEQVVETVQDLKAEPVMTRAVEAIFARSVRLGLESAFADQPAEASAVVEWLENKLRQTENSGAQR